MTNQELFDQKVERFLKKQMSPDEERSFKEELSSDPEKLARAKVLALAVKEMKSSQSAKDQKVVNAVANTDNESLERMADGSFMADFDEKVETFLKGLMSKEEEKSFFAQLNSNSELKDRAKVMALAIERMQKEGYEKDQAIVDKIKSTDMDTLRKIAYPKARVVPLIRYFAIAASILLFAGFFGVYQYDTYQTKATYGDFAEYTSTLNSSLTARSQETLSDSIVIQELNSLFTLVQKGDSIDYAINQLSIYSNYQEIEDNEVYKDNSAYIDWNLAMAYLQKGEKKDAKRVLGKLISEHKGQPIADKAQNVLDKLQKVGWFNW